MPDAMPNAKYDQAARFAALAKELECDPDEAAFKEKLGHIARQKPKEERQEGKGRAADADQS